MNLKLLVLTVVTSVLLDISANSFPQQQSDIDPRHGRSYKDFFKINLSGDKNENDEKTTSSEKTGEAKKKFSKFKKKPPENHRQSSELIESDKKVKNKPTKLTDYLALSKIGGPEKSISSVLSSLKTKAITLKKPEVDRSGNDTARLFGLNYNYPTDALSIGLQFTIPFLNIPLNSLFSGTTQGLGSILSLNKSTLIIGGLLALGALILIPLGLSYFGGSLAGGLPFLSGLGRKDGPPGSSPENQLNVLTQINEALQKHSIDSQTCMKRFICVYVKSSSESVKKGQGKSRDLIIEGVSSNWLVKKFLGGTEVEEAIAYARSGGDCDHAYSFKRCPVNQSSLYRGLLNFLESDIDF